MLKYAEPNKRNQLYYWHKEQRGSNAEVDYIMQKNEEIIPIEIKSGSKGQMQSMRIFLKEHNLNKGIRISLENFANTNDIDVFPLYAVSNLSA